LDAFHLFHDLASLTDPMPGTNCTVEPEGGTADQQWGGGQPSDNAGQTALEQSRAHAETVLRTAKYCDITDKSNAASEIDIAVMDFARELSATPCLAIAASVRNFCEQSAKDKAHGNAGEIVLGVSNEARRARTSG
jgi:hypothetical protein